MRPYQWEPAPRPTKPDPLHGMLTLAVGIAMYAVAVAIAPRIADSLVAWASRL
jgi:hypothetical protein